MADMNEIALSYIEEGLKDFDESLKEKTLPEIVIGEFVDIKTITSKGVKKNLFGELDERGSLDDGLIGSKTTSLITTDVSVTAQESPIVTWAKSTQWNIQELYEAQQLGVSLDTIKLNTLYRNCMQTIQKSGFLGHKEDSRITGLLNSAKVSITASPLATKPISAMTADEARAFFVDLFIRGYDRTGGALFPNMLAIDSFDLAYLSIKSAGQKSDGMHVSALDILSIELGKIAGHPVMIRGIPNKFAQGIVAGKNRAVVYTRDIDVVEYPVLYPETLGVHQFNIMTLQSGLYARFGCVDFKDTQLAAYVDYPSTDPSGRMMRAVDTTVGDNAAKEAKELEKKAKKEKMAIAEPKKQGSEGG